MKKKIAWLLATPLLAGCMTVGKPFASGRVAELKIGVTTKAEVRQKLGQPWRYGLEDGAQTWTYGRYRYSLFSPAETEDLVVRFDAKGVVASYSYNTTQPGD